MINIGQALKEHREAAELSQSELARRTGIKQANISRWEKNENFPNIIDCITLADFYGISIDYLVGYENEDGSKNEIFARLHRPAPKNIYSTYPKKTIYSKYKFRTYPPDKPNGEGGGEDKN